MEYTFKEFFAIHANKMKWKIPNIHMRLIDFIDNEDNWENDTKVLLLWRAVGKSTIADLWVAYMLSKDPTLRFLILSASKNAAKRSSQDILFIIRTHPLCRHLVSTELETQQDRFFVKGSKDRRNPSVSAYGIMSNVTSARADYLLLDDVEVAKNCGDDTKRYDLRRRLSEGNNLLDAEIGRRLFIGTYHDTISIYDDEINNGAAFLRVPLLKNVTGEFPNIVGDSQWPERFDDDEVDKRQRGCASRAEFYSQYLLVPQTMADSVLDASLLIPYTDEIAIKYCNKILAAKIGKFEIKSCSAWWDPALSKKKRDDSVLALIFQDEVGNLFIHRVWKLEGEVEDQCKQIKVNALEFEIPVVSVETNGIGAFLPQILRKTLLGTEVGVDAQFTTKKKFEKLIEAFETPLSAGILFVHESVFDTPFLSQIRDYSIHYRGKDDFIDAAASAILHEPVRLGAGGTNSYKGKVVKRWMNTENAKLDRDYAFDA